MPIPPQINVDQVLTDTAKKHILMGEGAPDYRGGHGFHSAVVGKTVFPERWTETDIIIAIRATLQFPAKVIELRQELILLAVIDKVVVEVTLKKTSRGVRLHHAFPRSGDGVFRNDPHGRTPVSLDLSELER